MRNITNEEKFKIFKEKQGVVYGVAKSIGLNNTNQNYEDIIQDGMIKLWELISEYDDSNKIKFGNYLFLYVRYDMMKKAKDYVHPFTITQTMKQNLDAIRELTDEGASMEYMAKCIGASEDMVATIQSIANQDNLIKLDRNIGSSSDDTKNYSTIIPDNSSQLEYDNIINKLDHEKLMNDIYRYLDDRDKKVIDGIINEKTHSEIAKDIGYSRSMVSTIYGRILKKLQEKVDEGELVM